MYVCFVHYVEHFLHVMHELYLPMYDPPFMYDPPVSMLMHPLVFYVLPLAYAKRVMWAPNALTLDSESTLRIKHSMSRN